MRNMIYAVVCASCAGLLSGCSPEAAAPTTEPAAATPSTADRAKFRLTGEPAGAQEVIQVREVADDGDDVIIVGRIGGSANPWVNGRAAFSIVDSSLKACSDIPGDKCAKPWDYCCETTNLPTSTALIKVVDDDGGIVDVAAKQLLDVKELSTVVVKGTAQRDEAGNLTVLASGVFVRQK